MTTLRKIGNSVGLGLPKSVLEEAGLSAGSEVDVRVVGEQIVISKSDSVYEQSMKSFERGRERYKTALDILAK